MTEKPNENKDLQPESAGGCDSTPHPPVGGALPHLDSGGVGGDQHQHTAGPPPESTENPQKSGSPLEDPQPIHVLATFDNQSDLLAGMRRSAGWIKLTEEAAHRALLPAFNHVHIRGVLKRLDEISLAEARDVIRILADERERLVDKAHPKL